MRIKKVSESIAIPEGHIIDSLEVASSTNAPSINAVNEALNGAVLYDNPTGTNGNITLSDNFSNYRYIDVEYGWYQNNSFNRGIEVKRFTGKSSNFRLTQISVSNGYWQLSRLQYNVSGNTLTKDTSVSYLIDSPSSYSQETYTRVVKVIGYK